MKKLNNIHPGEILSEEFLKPLQICVSVLSKDIALPENMIIEILNGKRSITTNIAVRLSKYFGNSSEFWSGLQYDFDIA